MKPKLKFIIPKAKRAWLHSYTIDIYAIKYNKTQRKSNKSTGAPINFKRVYVSAWRLDYSENLKGRKTLHMYTTISFSVKAWPWVYTLGFRRRHVTTGSWGGGRRWYRQLSGWQMFLKKRLEWPKRLCWRDGIIIIYYLLCISYTKYKI